MSNDVKLEPCPAPWCAKDEPEVEVTGYRGMEFVVCGNCGCTGPEGNSPAEAIAAWNTRHQPQERETALDICPACNGSGVGVADTLCVRCTGCGGVLTTPTPAERPHDAYNLVVKPKNPPAVSRDDRPHPTEWR